jgi:hypothetical protein
LLAGEAYGVGSWFPKFWLPSLPSAHIQEQLIRGPEIPWGASSIVFTVSIEFAQFLMFVLEKYPQMEIPYPKVFVSQSWIHMKAIGEDLILPLYLWFPGPQKLSHSHIDNIDFLSFKVKFLLIPQMRLLGSIAAFISWWLMEYFLRLDPPVFLLADGRFCECPLNF